MYYLHLIHPKAVIKLHTARVPQHYIQRFPIAQSHDALNIHTFPVQIGRKRP